MATMTITGLYNFDDTIFSEMSFPEGFTNDNQETTIDEIIFECAELELLYPDPDIMKLAIKRWSAAELPSWQRIYNALQEQYEVLWNVDANITETTERDVSNANTHSYSGTGEDSTTDDVHTTRADSVQTDGTDTLSSTAFNTVEFRNRDRNTVAEVRETGVDEVKEGSGTRNNEWTDTGNDTGTVEESVTHSIRRTGNIGVTTAQQMLEAEINLAKYNIIRTIVDSFKKRFCLLIY